MHNSRLCNSYICALMLQINAFASVHNRFFAQTHNLLCLHASTHHTYPGNNNQTGSHVHADIIFLCNRGFFKTV